MVDLKLLCSRKIPSSSFFLLVSGIILVNPWLSRMVKMIQKWWWHKEQQCTGLCKIALYHEIPHKYSNHWVSSVWFIYITLTTQEMADDFDHYTNTYQIYSKDLNNCQGVPYHFRCHQLETTFAVQIVRIWDLPTGGLLISTPGASLYPEYVPYDQYFLLDPRHSAWRSLPVIS